MAASSATAHAQCRALRFSTAPGQVATCGGSDAFHLGSALTLEAWARVEGSWPNGTVIGTVGGGLRPWKLGVGLNGSADAELRVTAAGEDAVTAYDVVVQGQWQHYAGTYDGATLSGQLASGPIDATGAIPDWEAGGLDSYDRLGQAAAIVGDTDGDGRTEILTVAGHDTVVAGVHDRSMVVAAPAGRDRPTVSRPSLVSPSSRKTLAGASEVITASPDSRSSASRGSSLLSPLA